MLLAQNTQDYYLEIKEGFELGEIQKTINPNQTVNLTMANMALANELNTKQIFSFKKAFSNSQNSRLQRVYILRASEDIDFSNIIERIEIQKITPIINEIILTSDINIGMIPNDYEDIITGGRNTALDLIKTPLAWSITTGDPNVVIGVVDAEVDLYHEDLQGSIIETVIIDDYNGHHGAGVTGMINAQTNNGKGIASIAPETKVVFVQTNGGLHSLTQGLVEIIHLKNTSYPSLKIVNCSWASSINYEYLQEVIYGQNGILDNDILIIAAAGNQGDTTYRYPAAYNGTMSVTTVGHRFPIGYIHNLQDPNGILYWHRSWKDCFAGKPDYGEGGNTRNDKVSVTSPGQILLGLTTNYSDYPEGYRLMTATSPATPIVSGLAGLILSINPNLSAPQIKQIIEMTADDIYHISYNQPYIGQLGTGRINAFRAVKTAQCMLNPTGDLDLAMQNSNIDLFVEPDTETEIFWESDDIWVRNQDDGNLIDVHQNPEYDANNPNYVYVRVTNNSCVTSLGNDNIKLYWAKANTSLSWPTHWDGSLYIEDPVTQEDVLMGNEIGTLNIPVLGPGESKLLEFEWSVPNPDNYTNINPNPWHFCLLARIESLGDPMTFSEGNLIYSNVKNNNNIVWKNTTVVDIYPNTRSQIGGVVAIGNPTSSIKAYNLQFIKENSEAGKAIYEEAEVTVQMDNTLYNAWVKGGEQGQNFDSTREADKKIAIANNMTISNLQLNPNEIGTLYLKFNFLTSEISTKRDYTYHVIQRDASTNEIIGGETYKVHKYPRPIFYAYAGNDEEIDKNESITITAAQINEAAVYNWYDPEGTLIYTGTDLTVSPAVTKTYRLEIITDNDGYKDYDDVKIMVNPYKLGGLVPNPATNIVTTNYIADEASSAYLMVVSNVTGISNNYILDTVETSINLNISNYPNGLYSVALVCDGKIVDSKNLVKQ
ncbi:S8 family serine peptidase [Aequorivita sp. Q41]|uniref:S8 family serine peptidase n=1 Tax=Aequorivita sp. Q41 TaxID=3153300 RepID=UPI003242EE45